jgi:transcriptional regulator with XRE-family HTH domain
VTQALVVRRLTRRRRSLQMLATASIVSGVESEEVPAAGVRSRWRVENVGGYLKEQRLASRLSLRQLAEQAGVSNPYLSQIERGLRKPSADVLQQIAKALRISAEQVYVQAGLLNPRHDEAAPDPSVEVAIMGDSRLSERQKRSLLDVYESFAAQGQPDQTSHPASNSSSHQ